MDELFIFCARFYYRMVRFLNITYFTYNNTTKRLEQRNHNPRKRRLLRRILFLIVVSYSSLLAIIPIIFLLNLSYYARKCSMFEFATIFYNILFCSTVIANIVIIIYQLHTQSTSRVLVKLFNKLFAIQEKVAVLTLRSIEIEFYMKCLLLFKFILIIWIVILTACQYRFLLSDLFGYPLFEFVYVGNHMWLLNILKIYPLLNDFVRRHTEQLQQQTQCSTKCKDMAEPLCRALNLNIQTNELLVCFLQRFNWFEKLAILSHLQLIRLYNNLLTCAVTGCTRSSCGKSVSNTALHLLNVLLLAIVNDSLQAKEENLREMLTIIVGKLAKRGSVCNDCQELLRLIDAHFCSKYIRTNNIGIFEGFCWSKYYMFVLLHSLLLIAINMAQFELYTLETFDCSLVQYKGL